jgi:hypothetical protein
LFGLFFDAEDGNSRVLQNAGKVLLDFTASHPRIGTVKTEDYD